MKALLCLKWSAFIVQLFWMVTSVGVTGECWCTQIDQHH